MNKEIATEWCTLLESGEFQQGRERLVRPEGYCCLGVLCELYRRTTGLGTWAAPENSRPGHLKQFIIEGEQGITALPHSVMKWAGLKSTNGFYKDEVYGNANLAAHNDLGKSFVEISQIIKERVDVL